jgi:hypothetical protein
MTRDARSLSLSNDFYVDVNDSGENHIDITVNKTRHFPEKPLLWWQEVREEIRISRYVHIVG